MEIGGLIVSNNEISKERYVGFVRAFEKFRSKFKTIKFAANLFGSLVQGKFLTGGPDGNWQTSDIDAKLRFDVDDVVIDLKKVDSILVAIFPNIDAGYILESGNMNELSALLLSEFIKLLVEEVPHMKANKKLTDNIKIYPISANPNSWCFVGHDFEFKRVASWFFADDVGGGMRFYIQTYLKYLQEKFSVVDCNKKWDEIIHNTDTYIRSDLKDRSPYKYVPRTFQEALEFYEV